MPQAPTALVVAGEEGNEVILRRHQRIEQKLAILAARITLADPRSTCQDVVPVELLGSREHPVVETEQDHCPVRHRAHRHHRAHGETAGPEVGPGGSAP